MENGEMPIGAKFAVLHRSFRREIDALLREKDLTGAQMGALRAIGRLEYERGGEISQRDVELLTHTTHPTMTEIIKKLEKKGFITVEASCTDRRRKAIRFTERAGELVREMHDVDEKTFAKFCAGLGAEQTAQLCAMLDHMIENICGGCADGGGQK